MLVGFCNNHTQAFLTHLFLWSKTSVGSNGLPVSHKSLQPRTLSEHLTNYCKIRPASSRGMPSSGCRIREFLRAKLVVSCKWPSFYKYIALYSCLTLLSFTVASFTVMHYSVTARFSAERWQSLEKGSPNVVHLTQERVRDPTNLCEACAPRLQAKWKDWTGACNRSKNLQSGC